MKISITLKILAGLFLFISLPMATASAQSLEAQLLEIDDFLEKYDFSTEFGDPVCHRTVTETCAGPYPCEVDLADHQTELFTRKNGTEVGRITVWGNKSGMQRNDITSEYWEDLSGNVIRLWVQSENRFGRDVSPRGLVYREDKVRIDGVRTSVETVWAHFETREFNRPVAKHSFLVTRDLPAYAQVLSHTVNFINVPQRGRYDLTDFRNSSCHR